VLVWLLIAGVAQAATRPRYGGTLRVEIRGSIETPDPPVAGHGMPDLAAAFNIARWEAGRRAVYEANENAPGGRPYLDSVDIQMGKTLHDQSIDLELGKADIVELGPGELLRQSAGRRVWSSSPVRVIALLFNARIQDARIREALALAVDRSAIHSVLLQRQGEISGALLPQWISGYAFVFPTVSDAARARTLLAGVPQGQRTLSLGVEDAAARPIAERIALNARYAGLAISVIPQAANADVRLVEVRMGSSDPVRALASLAAALGLPEPPHAD
jgi:peptide/nickel transport system substrate-binding protein